MVRLLQVTEVYNYAMVSTNGIGL